MSLELHVEGDVEGSGASPSSMVRRRGITCATQSTGFTGQTGIGSLRLAIDLGKGLSAIAGKNTPRTASAAAVVTGLLTLLGACAGAGSEAPVTVTVAVPATGRPAASAATSTIPVARPTANSTATATTAVTATRTTFPLGVGSFGSARLPASPDAIVAAATPLLGPPTKKTEGSGCELAGPDQKSVVITWGDITAYGEAGPGATVKIDSWTVDGTTTKVPITLPYGTFIGMKRSALVASFSGETVDDSKMFAEGDIVIKDDLWWSLDKTNTKVVSVTYNPHVCE